jgi:hypothetical protein
MEPVMPLFADSGTAVLIALVPAAALFGPLLHRHRHRRRVSSVNHDLTIAGLGLLAQRTVRP